MSNPSRDLVTQPDFTLETPAKPSPPERLASIDAYRGLVMFLMMAEVHNLRRVARATGG